MKVGVYYGPGDVRCEERPIPEIGPREILVEMKACGICGSDLMDWYLINRAPLVLGHEPSGIVVKVGEGVDKFKVGDRVFVHHHVSCMACRYCIHGDFTMCDQFRKTHLDPGGFAEYFRVPEPNVKFDTLKLPDEMSFEEATIIEPLACCIRAVNRCNILPGDMVTVIGAGSAGAMITKLSKLSGAAKVIVSDIIDRRLEIVRKFGADVVINPTKEDMGEIVLAETDGYGADVVIVTAPSIKAIESGINVCRKGGLLCLFAPTSPEEALHVRPHKLFFSEIKIISSYSTTHIETRMALNMIRTRTIDAREFITHRFKLEEISKAYKVAKSMEGLKVIVLNE